MSIIFILQLIKLIQSCIKSFLLEVNMRLRFVYDFFENRSGLLLACLFAVLFLSTLFLGVTINNMNSIQSYEEFLEQVQTTSDLEVDASSI